jgi:transcriptional regulator with XRE-family HTH domain
MPYTMIVRSAGDLGAAVTEARLVKGLTQQQVAAMMNLDRTYVSRLESGLNVQLLDRSLRILRRLGAEVLVVVPDADDSVPPPPISSKSMTVCAPGWCAPNMPA